MGHLEGRVELEALFAATWAREFRRQFKMVASAIENSMPWNNPATWVTIEVRAATASQPILDGIFSAGAFQAEAGLVEGLVVPTVIENRAAVWASQYSFELVKGINSTTLAKLQKIISEGLQEGLSSEEIAEILEPIFGSLRAQSIAVTETTRASSEGQRSFIDELKKLGVFTITSWLTARDNRVDGKICAPLDGVVRENGVYTHPRTGVVYRMPPAHTNCRCAEDDELIE